MRQLTLPCSLLVLACCAGAHAAPPLQLTPRATLVGEDDEDHAGTAVAGAGDVNGDGLDDLLVGAPWKSDLGSYAGEAYLVFGRGGGWNALGCLCQADASFRGVYAGDEAGGAVAGAGDVNGDGFDDFLVGAVNGVLGMDAVGEVFLVLGHASGWAPDESLATVTDSFLGEVDEDKAGWAVAGVGDVDGDGLADFLASAPFNDEAATNAGQTYLILGTAAAYTQDTDLSTVDASFLGEASEDRAGTAVAGAGDVNGDGLDDLLVGSAVNDEAASNAGQAYLVFGREAGWAMDTSLADSDASFTGVEFNDEVGYSVAGVGDVDGDGFDDILVGAKYEDVFDVNDGAAYLFLGSDSGWTMDRTIDYADASFAGMAADDRAGHRVAAAGDIDGDGFDDMLVTAPTNDEADIDAGQIYVIMGHDQGWAMATPLDEAASASMLGEGRDDYLGTAAGLGDVDGDGLGDLLFGALYNDGGGTMAGAAYMIRGFVCEDIDGDGYSTCDGDCDDTDPTTYPGAEDPCDGVDSDCGDDLDDELDDDGDGFAECDGDCDDGEAAAFPGAAETCDGFDNDCDGVLFPGEEDEDTDGFGVCAGDCNDLNPTIFPGASEGCDGVDTDCDGAVDPSELDDDGDGFAECEDDCDDTAPDVYPGATDICGDGIDSDCMGDLDYEEDFDGDGYAPCDGDCHDNDVDLNPADMDADGVSSCDGDCDDLDDEIYPGAPERCNGLDDDCNGSPGNDETDYDADGFMPCEGDCDDYTGWINPDQEENTCNGVDDDCDPDTEDMPDDDGDEHSICYGDCDDDDPGTYPGAIEACDGQDNDCDGTIDEGFDLDGDGFSSCIHGDCDDDDPLIYPEAPEIPYDGIDQNCVGGDLTDIDGDGHDGGQFGDDCDDTRAWIHPGAVESCLDGVDADCDGVADAQEDDCVEGGCRCSGTGSDRRGALLLVVLLCGLIRRSYQRI